MTSHSEGDGKGFARMQHLIDEMSASNYRIDLFSNKYSNEEAVANKDKTVPEKKSSPMDQQLEALYDDAWRSEESDGASLQEVPISTYCNDEGDSGCEEVVNSAIAEVSNDFLSGVRHTAAQNLDSDESRISSDNDVKRVVGRASYAPYPETGTGLSDTDWNPYGTESDNNQSPRLHTQDIRSDSKSSLLTFTPLFNSTDINTVTPNSPVKVSRLKEEGMSGILEQTERDSTLSHHLIPDITTDLLNAGNDVKVLYTPIAVERKERLLDQGETIDKTKRHLSSSKESISSHDEKKCTTSTSSTGYSSATSGSRFENINRAPLSKPISVIERAKQIGIPEDILLNKNTKSISNNVDLHLKNPNSNCRENDRELDDQLGKKVRALLADTTHLSTFDKGSSVDYTVLQRDLQEIQDNLDSFGVSYHELGKNRSQSSSEGEGEIIPSTTNTPEKKRNMMWDYAGDIGALENHPNAGLMQEVSLTTHATGSQKPSLEKSLYNSDGDETRTSESSTKMEDHAAADLVLAEMSEILHPSVHDLNNSTEVDQMVSTLQNKRRQLESRYQQLNNQGLAEKVYRILKDQNPESQANGILSEVSADEKNMRTRMALNIHDKDKNFNYSSTSSWLDEFNQSFNPQFDVRKKLDLSGLSSVDSSLMFEKPTVKGFSALDDAKRLLSSQMMKASERNFNNSVEMRIPQTVQCYPLFVHSADENNSNGKSNVEEQEAEDQGAVGVGSVGPNKDDRTEDENPSNQQDTVEETRSNTSPNNSDQGINASVRPKDKYRPYRPPGSKDVYYTESDTASVADSVTTMESTHIGSDDAKGPNLPSNALGSRKDPSNAGGSGIYSHPNLSTVCEDTEPTVMEEKNENNSLPRSCLTKDTRESPKTASADLWKEIKKAPESSTSYLANKFSPNSRERSYNQRYERGRIDARAREGAGLTFPHYSEGEDTNFTTTSISSARREARWARRRDEINRERLLPYYEDLRSSDNSRATRPEVGREEPVSYSRYPFHEDSAFDKRSGANDNEPLSLRIQMAYADENKLHEKNSHTRKENFERMENQQNQFMSERKQAHRAEPETFSLQDRHRYSPELRPIWPSTETSTTASCQKEVFSSTTDDILYSRSLSPAFRQALSSNRCESNLHRSGSDESLHLRTREARLSPAFRHALSPELRSAIRRRSPLLSENIERSLAQPPSDYPTGREREERMDERFQRPVFLARERPLSPSGIRSRPFCESPKSQAFRSELSPKPRTRSHSPSYNERTKVSHGSPNERPKKSAENYGSLRAKGSSLSPKRKVELTLERMSSDSEADLEMDQEPLSKRAQLLKSALSNEQEASANQDINAMWEKFKAMNDSSSSSINSSKIEAVSNLLKSPSHHLVSQYVKDREEYRIERQERAEFERERRLKEQQMQKHSSSEDEIHQRYEELLAMKEEERMKRRASKKKKGKSAGSASIAEKNDDKDNLFSIPEDRSHEPSSGHTTTPSKPEKSKVSRQPHVIDPNMLKLREKIAKQKTKVDKDIMKEMRRVEKLKKLESLLVGKKKGKISNETLQNCLEEMSSTSAIISDLSQESGKENQRTYQNLSDDSTTAKDSSAEMHAWKAEKERRQKEFETRKEIEERKVLKEKNNYKSKSTRPSRNQIHLDLKEIKLLKLVKEGYLSAEEAYRLAVDRASQLYHDGLNTSKDSSINNENGFYGKPHKFYSPYSRYSNLASSKRHVPKLKFSDTVPHSSYGVEDFEVDELSSHQRMRNLEQAMYQEKLGARSGRDCYRKGDKKYREKSYSPASTRHLSPSASRHRSSSPAGKQYTRKPKKTISSKSVSEKKDHVLRGSVAWQIPMDLPPSQWDEPVPKPLQDITSSFSNKPRKTKHHNVNQREPLNDKQESNKKEDSIWTKSSHPQGIPKLEWAEVVKRDALASKTNHWEVDPMMDRVQYILNRPDPSHGNHSHRSNFSDKGDISHNAVSKLSLQELFLARKQDFISKCSERQKRMKLAKDERQLQECLRLEREAIFSEHERLHPSNLYAHPYSDNLFQPKHRIFTKKEMKSLTAKKYSKLPEVVEKNETTRKQMEAKLNRLRANLFNKKVQTDILRKTGKQRS